MNRSLGTLAATGAALWALHSPAQAVVQITVLQQGTDVVASFSGSLNLDSFSGLSGGAFPFLATVFVGEFEYIGLGGVGGPALGAVFSAPAIGVGGFLSPLIPDRPPASTVSGDMLGFIFGGPDPIPAAYIITPLGYLSGDPLSGGATWDSNTLAGLGLNPGTYTFTWGAGANVESLELQIGAAPVPEPATLALMLAGITAVGAVAGRQRARRA